MAVFFLFCALPTAAIVAWGAVCRSPWHRQAEAQRLGHELGLEVAIHDLCYPRPGVTRYEGLTLSDPETGHELFRCPSLEVSLATMADSHGLSRPAIVLTAPRAEIESSACERLDQTLQQRLQCPQSRPETEIRLSVEQLVLRSPQKNRTLLAVEGGIGALPGGVQAQASFRLPESRAAEPIQIRMVRNRQIVPPANGFELTTAGNELPCQLLALAVPEVAALGPDCRLAGYAWTYHTPAGLQGELTGQLLQVDLGGLVSSHFPHPLRCTADITVQRARFQNGRLEELAGLLSAGPGEISRSLVESAVSHLGLAQPVTVSGTAEMLPFDCLAVEFSLTSEGLWLAGRCPTPQRGTVLSVARQPLLGEPTVAQPQPVAALIQLLAPASAIQVPATRQTDWLTRLLPATDVISPSR